MLTRSLIGVLREHPFAQDMDPRHLETLAACAQNRVFQAGDYLWRQGEHADVFYLVRSGEVALEIFVPNQGPVHIERVSAGDVLGWSWLVPPYQWPIDARVASAVRALVLDGDCLRAKCEQDHCLGYQVLKRFTPLLARRLQAARLRLLEAERFATR